MPQTPTPLTDVQKLPAIITLKELASFYRVSTSTIRRGLALNEFHPLPWQKYPYRWRKTDVAQHYQTRETKLKTRRHGFAAAKARRLDK